MSNETDLDELRILRHGYERFLSNSGDLDDCENAIITVRRQQQITTHFGPLTTKNKIKVSLSQEQILNQTNRFRPNIQRSQSINIQKLVSPNEIIRSEYNLNRRNSIRPSLIPVKIKESKLRALTMGPNKNQNIKESQQSKSVRKLSDPFERRNYVSQQEASLSSLPLPMAQSADPSLCLEKNRSAHTDLLDKFKCGICLNVLSDSRVLDCLHTFCLQCLFKIETTNQSKATTNKLNSTMRSNSFESKKSDMSSSNCSDESKECDKKMSKSITSFTAKPIRKTYLSTHKNRPDELKKSLTLQPKRPLSSITEKSKVSLKCPVCGLRTEILIGGVTRVPKNFLLERQLQNAIEKVQAQHLTDAYCSQCYKEIEAIAHCLNCELNLCDVCQEAHLRQRWTSKHNVIALFDLKRKHLDVTNGTLKCFIHPTQDLKLYCVNCDQVACHNCTILLHKGHKFETIERAKLHVIKSFEESLERNQQFHDYVNDSISKLAGNISEINANAEAVQTEIELFLKDYFEALDAHKEALLRQIAKIKDVKSLSIMEQQEYLKKRANELKQANHFARNLLQKGNDVEVLTFIGILQKRFEFCQKAKIPSEPKIDDTFQFLREIRAPATPHQHNIPIYGILATLDGDLK